MKKRGMERIKEHLLGSTSQWYGRLRPLYAVGGEERLREQIRREQQRVMRRYRLSLAAAGILLICAVAVSRGDTDSTAWRLEYGGHRQEISWEVVNHEEVKRGGEETAETEVDWDETERRISREMLGNNANWNRITGSLLFPERTDGNILLRYETGNSERVSPQGLVDGIGAERGEEIKIGVTMMRDHEVRRFTIQGTVFPPETEEEIRQALRFWAERVKEAMEGGTETEKLLAEARKSGIRMTAVRSWSGAAAPMACMAVLLVAIYVSRFSETTKRVERKRTALREQLPLLTEQLILMMNAGLILSEALQAAAESVSLREQEEDDLFSDVRRLCRLASETRRPVTALLCEYAAETGTAELVRFSSMMADHDSRGSASLVAQLKTERDHAVERQWKEREGKCREMEVKLTGPLFLLLGAIMILAIGPVLVGV